jgi:choline-glycine betaine transporter
MEGLKLIPYIALVLAISGIVLGASAITLSKFRDTTTNANALAAIDNASAAIVDVSEQLPTVAIIGIMVIIISVIAGVFVYMRYFG